MNIPTLETKRLILREWRESDLDALCEFHADPLTTSVYRVSFSRMEVWRRAATWLGHWHLRGYGIWAVEDKETAAYAGQCGLWYPEGWGDVEIGYGIQPKFRELGIAVEAATRVRDYGYMELKLNRLVSYIQPSNTNSIRVAEKLGATPNGEFMMGDIPHTIYLHPKSTH
jgi:RimJ/RimL family protein N-acetyltransferase